MLAASVMVLLGIVGANTLISAFAVAAVIDAFYSSWRREHEPAGEAKVA